MKSGREVEDVATMLRQHLRRTLGTEAAERFMGALLGELGWTHITTAEQLYSIGAALRARSSDAAG